MLTAMANVQRLSAGAYVINRSDGRSDGQDWKEDLPGAPYGAGISIMQERRDAVGQGPPLHTHPYPETFIIRNGSARFTVGDEEVVGHAGQIVVVPADTPHTFRTEDTAYEASHIHASDEFVTQWLE